MFEDLHRGMEWLVELCERWLESEGIAVVQQSVAGLVASDGVYTVDDAGNHAISPRYLDRECLEDFPATIYHDSTNEIEACRAVVTEELLSGLEAHLRPLHRDALEDLEPFGLDLFALPLISGQGVASLMAKGGLDVEWMHRKFERNYDACIVEKLHRLSDRRIPFEAYTNTLRGLPALETMEATRPGAVAIFMGHIIARSEAGLTQLEVNCPEDVERLLKRDLRLDAESWNRISVLSPEAVHEIFRHIDFLSVEVPHYTRTVSTLLKLRASAGRRIPPSVVSSIMTAIEEYGGHEKIWDDVFPVTEAFVSECLLPKTHRSGQLPMRAIRSRLHSVLDWAFHTENIEISDWPGYVRRAAEWHEAESRGGGIVKGGSPNLSWTSRLSEFTDGGYRIVPIESSSALEDEGRRMINRFRGGQYGKLCSAGWSRVFSIRNDSERDALPIATLQIMSDGNGIWGLGQILGYDNATVDGEVMEVAEHVVVRYNRSEAGDST